MFKVDLLLNVKHLHGHLFCRVSILNNNYVMTAEPIGEIVRPSPVSGDTHRIGTGPMVSIPSLSNTPN